MTTVEQEEMAGLRKISNAIPPDNKNAQQEKAKDDFDLFGEYVATKMRKLSPVSYTHLTLPTIYSV